MIKKLWLLFIIWLSFIGFSNAWFVQTVWLEESPSIYNSNYNLTFLKGGGLLSSYLWQWKPILALSWNVLFWRTNEGMPYFQWWTWTSFQWYFWQYASCDEITGFDYSATNCSFENITWDYQNLFKNFFKNVKARDYVYYDFAPKNQWPNYYSYKIYVCFSSHSIWKSLCFIRHYNRASNAPYTTDKWNLTNSKGYNYTFWTIPTELIWKAPWQVWYNGDRTPEIETGTTNTWINNIWQCPTIWQLMKNMWTNYNTWLCYNNTQYFNWTSFEQVEKQDIFTIFNDDYTNYTNRISIYRNNCNAPANWQSCQNAFSGEYKKYSIIANAINSNVDEKNLWNYCNMWLNYDPNWSTCVANTWYIKEPATVEELTDTIINWNTVNIPVPSTTTTSWTRDNVFKALCDGTNDENCFWTGDIRNVFKSMDNIYQKITWLFKQRNGVNGIIPEYILRITFITILFTVIFKK